MLATPRILYICAKYGYLARKTSFGHPEYAHISKEWAHQVLRALNINIQIQSKPLQENVILVGNHVSYLDIPLLLSELPVRFLAKSSVRYWPVIGHCAQVGGTIFVRRGSLKSRRQAVEKIIQEVSCSPQPMTIFPTGTTTDGPEGVWRPGAFRIARSTRRPIQPFRIRYTPSRLAAYIGNDSFVGHLEKLSRNGPIKVELEFGQEIEVHSSDQALQQARSWVNQGL